MMDYLFMVPFAGATAFDRMARAAADMGERWYRKFVICKNLNSASNRQILTRGSVAQIAKHRNFALPQIKEELSRLMPKPRENSQL